MTRRVSSGVGKGSQPQIPMFMFFVFFSVSVFAEIRSERDNGASSLLASRQIYLSATKPSVLNDRG